MDATDRELEEAGLGQFLYARKSEYSYSGMLPPPDRFAEYDADTRERICRWNDAWTVDESRRQGRLVDNEIKQQNRSSATS